MKEAALHWSVSCICGIAAAAALAWALESRVEYRPIRLRAGTPSAIPAHAAEKGPAVRTAKQQPSNVPRSRAAEPRSPGKPAPRPAHDPPNYDTPSDAPAPSNALPQKVEPGPSPSREGPPQPDTSHYGFPIEDEPGGNVSLFAVLVNHEGRVIDVQLPVPSRHLLDDIAMAMALYKNPVKLDPPLEEGKTVWLPIRMEYRPASEDVLP